MDIKKLISFVSGGLYSLLLLFSIIFISPSLLQAAGISPVQYGHHPGSGQITPQYQYHQDDYTRPWYPDHRVMVYIRMSTINHGSLNQLRNAGVSITHVSEQYKIVTGYINANNIYRLNHLKSVRHVQKATKPLLNPRSPKPGPGVVGGPVTGPFHN